MFVFGYVIRPLPLNMEHMVDLKFYLEEVKTINRKDWSKQEILRGSEEEKL